MATPGGPARRVWHWALLAFLAWLALAYAMAPRLWTHHGEQPGLRPLPRVASTLQGRPGDPIDVGLVGTREEILHAMAAAGWQAGDPATARLVYAGRLPDLAFETGEQAETGRRDRVLLWKVLDIGAERRPVWLGAATADRPDPPGSATRRLDPDIDAARDRLIADLDDARALAAIYQVTGLGPTLFGSAGGERYRSDGEIHVGRLAVRGTRAEGPALLIAPPPLVGLKDRLWRVIGDRAGGS
ncbi:LssY C-terminal domain-containing protein [Ancylobacter oerskovii]|uniref:LssY C-terminal domain-containing protein n=1 Tax=Ancylobacter oerskovii TaxID=459519 RepID=A0ABW4YYL8_9HYPH|nr:LssY C-terminal domain-containing protein [Ancylobacter oerskovii]MBS7541701.1 LssY C-terminal domain-containing protein [Ancylobacter oerskovii]